MAENDTRSTKSLGSRLMSGSVWMIAMRWSMRLLGLVSTAILARLLTPEDFGLVAMAAIAVGLVEVFSQIGVELALIRHPNPQRRHYDTAWTFNLLTGLILGGLMVLVAPLAAAFFEEPRVEPVLWVLAAAPLVRGAVNIGIVDFRRDLRFAKDFQYNFITRIAGFVTTVTLALVFRNYWALVIGTMAHGVYGLIVSFFIHPYRRLGDSVDLGNGLARIPLRQDRDAVAVRGQDIAGLVGRSVVDGDDPEIAVGLAEGAVQRLAQGRHRIVTGDDDANAGVVCHGSIPRIHDANSLPFTIACHHANEGPGMRMLRRSRMSLSMPSGRPLTSHRPSRAATNESAPTAMSMTSVTAARSSVSRCR